MISYPASYHSIAVKCGIRNRFMRRWWRFSYYYSRMIQVGTVRPIFARFKYRSGKEMNQEDEKYRIKPRKKYARQVWLRNGKAIIVDPIEKKNAETENIRKEE